MPRSRFLAYNSQICKRLSMECEGFHIPPLRSSLVRVQLPPVFIDKISQKNLSKISSAKSFQGHWWDSNNQYLPTFFFYVIPVWSDFVIQNHVIFFFSVPFVNYVHLTSLYFNGLSLCYRGNYNPLLFIIGSFCML